MIAIVAPGQGAQKPGFLSPWRELPGAAAALASYADRVGIDLVAHGTTSDADTIRDTAVAQPLLVAAGIMAADCLVEGDGFAAASTAGVLPAVIAGHSVGEVTAAALAGVLDEGQALDLVRVRSQGMAAAAAREETGMAAVVGGVRDEVLAALSAQGLHPANINSAAQVVAAGPVDAISALVENPPARARVIPLQVAGAFHTPYMASAIDELRSTASAMDPRDPSDAVVLLSNAGGERVTSGRRFLDLIVSQVASPVDWEACMKQMKALGVTGLLELNPGGTLTGLAKRELKGIALQTLNTPDDLEAARSFVQEHSAVPSAADSGSAWRADAAASAPSATPQQAPTDGAHDREDH